MLLYDRQKMTESEQLHLKKMILWIIISFDDDDVIDYQMTDDEKINSVLKPQNTNSGFDDSSDDACDNNKILFDDGFIVAELILQLFRAAKLYNWPGNTDSL